MSWEAWLLLVQFTIMGFFMGVVPMLLGTNVKFSIEKGAGIVYVAFALLKVWLLLRVAGGAGL